MLNNIKVDNFKCFDHIELNNIKEMTLLTGPNNSGKSTVFQALIFIKNCIANKQVNWDSKILNLNSFYETVNNHDKKKQIQISCNFGVEFEVFGKKQTSIQFTSEINNGKITSQQALTCENIPIITWTNKYFTIHNSNFDKENDEKVTYKVESQIPILCELKENNLEEDFISSIILDEFKKLYYLAPNRGLTEWEYFLGDETSPIGTLGENTASYLHYKFSDKDYLFDRMESWIRAFDNNITVVKSPIKSGNKTHIKFDIKNSSVNLLGTGTGLNTVIPVVMNCIYSPEYSTILIEEPEMHLHTKALKILLDLFLEEINTNNKQIIFTTHSWDIHLDIYRRLQRKEIENEKISRIDFKNENGKVDIENIDLFRNEKFIDYRDKLNELLG